MLRINEQNLWQHKQFIYFSPELNQYVHKAALLDVAVDFPPPLPKGTSVKCICPLPYRSFKRNPLKQYLWSFGSYFTLPPPPTPTNKTKNIQTVCDPSTGGLTPQILLASLFSLLSPLLQKMMIWSMCKPHWCKLPKFTVEPFLPYNSFYPVY